MLAHATLTELLAVLYGVFFFATGIGLFLNPQTAQGLVKGAQDNVFVTFLLGAFAFVIGGLVVAFHNDWSAPLPIVVSLIGWLTLIRGLFILTLEPVFISILKWFAFDPRPVRIVSVLIIVLGGGLTYFGWPA